MEILEARFRDEINKIIEKTSGSKFIKVTQADLRLQHIKTQVNSKGDRIEKIRTSETSCDISRQKHPKRFGKRQTRSLKYVLSMHSRRLVKKTHFSLAEVQVLIHIFWKLTDKTFRMEYDEFVEFLRCTFGFECDPKLKWRGYDRLKSEFIYIGEFLKILDVMLRGTQEQRAKFAFEIYDLGGDGLINGEEIFCLLQDSFQTSELWNEDDRPLKEMVEYVMQILKTNRNDGVNLKKFTEVVKENPLLLECCCPMWPEEKYMRLFSKMVLK